MSSPILQVTGWYQLNVEGISTISLSIVDEGLTTSSTDVPANTAYRPRILNPEQFSIKRRPTVWPWGDTQSTQGAAFAQLQIDNYDGAFDFLTLADLRDSLVVLRLPVAMAFGDAHTVRDAPVMATMILDDAAMNTEDVITLTFKDTISLLDRPLPMRFNPPFVDANAALRMLPLSLGALRNVAPQLIDQEGGGTGMPIYAAGDAAFTNLTAVRDKGAVLDVYANPPQVQTALNHSGIQLQAPPVGKLTMDFSTLGTQSSIPGASDVLNGLGRILSTASGGVTTWTAPYDTNAPSGFTYDNPGGTRGTFGRLQAINGYAQDWVVSMSTKKMWSPTSGTYGLPMHVTTAFLQPGRTYRISINIARCFPPAGWYQNDGTWGFLIAAGTSVNDLRAVSASNMYGYSGYLAATNFADQQYSFLFTCPNDNVVRSIYIILVGKGTTYGNASGSWYGLQVELLEAFTNLPMIGIGLKDYFNEILYKRAAQPNDGTVWNVADLTALDTATGYEFGNHYEAQPTITTALKDPLDNYCAALFTDALGALRVRRLVDPKQEALNGNVVAAFDLTNTQRPIMVVPDRAQYLTTLIGAPHNWSVFGDSDFVSDTVTVPLDMRERFKRNSQYQLYAAKSPAGQYSSAIGAPIFDSLLDKTEHAQAEIDRVVGIYSPQIYSDGTVFNGKRRFVQFVINFDDPAFVAGYDNPKAAQDLLFGDVVTLTYPQHGFNNTPIMIAGTELFPFAQKLVIWGFF